MLPNRFEGVIQDCFNSIKFRLRRAQSSRNRKEILMKEKTNKKRHELTRRDFIKTSAVMGAAASLVSGTSRIYAAGSDRLRIGLIGCGGQGTRDIVSCVKSSPGESACRCSQ